MATITLTVADTAIPLITEILTDEGWDGVTTTLDVAVQQIVIRLFKDRAIQLRYKQNAENTRAIGDAAIVESDAAFTVLP